MSEVFDSTVFEQLKQQCPETQHEAKKPLNLTEKDAAYIIAENGSVGLRVVLRPRIEVAYGVDEATAKAVATVAADQIKAALRDKGQPDWSSEHRSLREELLVAFDELGNTGDARHSLLTYVQHCWDTYQQSPDDIIPCASIIQSSGYGKSQVLYQLAKETCRPDSGVRVLYTCNRMFRSTGFPATTGWLRDWLFYSFQDSLVIQLEAIYHYAQQNWSTVGHEWIELFVNTRAERTVCEKLKILEYELKKASPPLQDKVSQVSTSSKKVVVLTVDSAGGLLERDRGGLDYTCLLRKAAIEANKNIRKMNTEGGIFVIFVDRNLKVAGLSPSKSEIAHQGSAKVFPPFVLTHNLDVYWKRYCAELNLADAEVAAYKRIVIQDVRDETLKSLQAMGRPLWGSSLYAKLEIDRTRSSYVSTSRVI